MNFVGMGGGDRGLLDHDHYDEDLEGGHTRSRTPQHPHHHKMRGNQDLWLLYLLFKSIAFLW